MDETGQPNDKSKMLHVWYTIVLVKVKYTKYLQIFQYWQNKVKHSDVQLAKGCDDKCLYKTFCDIVMCP